MLLLLAIAIPAFSQTEESDAKLEELQKLQEAMYPDFIGSATPAPTPTAPSPVAETPETVPAYNFPDQLEVLAGDLSSTSTWIATRDRLEPGFEELRIMMLTSAPPDEVSQQIISLTIDLEVIGKMSAAQAPRQTDSIARTNSRIETQLEYMGGDYLQGAWRQLGNTDQLLRGEVDGLLRLLRDSDRDRGAAIGAETIPSDWEVGGFRHPSFRERIRGWQTSRLMEGFRNRREALVSLAKGGFQPPDAEYAREMGELARELATRQSDVPVTSRLAYRNATLRLDVMAENLLDFLQDNQSLHARRQARALEDAEADVQAFLELRPRFSR